MAKKKKAAERPLVDVFAENVRERRQAKGLSQEKLAQMAGLSVSYISMLERKQRTPPLDTVDTLCRALEIPPVAMFA